MPEETEKKELFSATTNLVPSTTTATLKLEDGIMTKTAGFLSFDYYNITFRCQVTAKHLGKLLDFLLNAEWKNEWGSIDIDEILKVEKTNAPKLFDSTEHT